MKFRPQHLTEHEWAQLQLPRRYQVLTWQLNVSWYPPAKTVKFVSTLRDPVEQWELFRRGAEKVSYPEHLEVIMGHVTNLYNLVEDVTGIAEPF